MHRHTNLKSRRWLQRVASLGWCGTCALNRLIVLAAKGYPWLVCMVSVATLTPQIFSEHNHLEIYPKFFFFASPSPVFQISLTARVVLGCSRQRELAGASLSCAKVRSRRNRRSGRDETKGVDSIRNPWVKTHHLSQCLDGARLVWKY
jgi:hypothetical protein